MKILLLAPQPFYTERGTPIAVRLAANVLCEAGHAVDILTYHEGIDVTADNLRIFRIRKPPLVSNVPIGFSWKKIVCDLALSVAAYRRLRATRYDVVHAVEEAIFPAILARRRFRFRLVYDMDSLMLDQLLQKYPVLRRARPALSWFEHMAVRQADLVLAVCPAIAEFARAVRSDAAVHVIPDVAFPPAPSDGTNSRTVDSLRRLFATDGPLAIYAGNLEPYQGIDLLLASIASLGSHGRCNLAVIGGTEVDQVRYRALAETLGIGERVRFTGPRPLAQLPELLAQGDILVSPRLAGSNTPMKIYSYLASGRAILATAIASHTQVLDERCACLVAPEARAFGAGLARLTQDGDLRQRLGTYAAQIAREQYSLQAFSQRLLDAYGALPVGDSVRSRARFR